MIGDPWPWAISKKKKINKIKKISTKPFPTALFLKHHAALRSYTWTYRRHDCHCARGTRTNITNSGPPIASLA